MLLLKVVLPCLNESLNYLTVNSTRTLVRVDSNIVMIKSTSWNLNLRIKIIDVKVNLERKGIRNKKIKGGTG